MLHSHIDPNAEGVVALETVSQQFTIFAVDGENFAVSLDEVKEIIRMPDVVRVPLAPPSLEGLANLRGTVLPIVNARLLFDLPRRDADDATRVVILDHGHPIGIVVDKVASVVTVEPDRIESASEVETSIRSDLLRGMIRDQDGMGLVMVLETRRLIAQEFELLAAQAREHVSKLAEDSAVSATRDEPTSDDEEIQLVSFEVAGQEYALPIASVREIVQLPEKVTKVPKAASSVMGVITLRERLLPVVSLRRQFRLEPAECEEHQRVAVVSVGPRQTLVGLVLDKVNEVLRVRSSGIDAMPGVMAANGDISEITALCRLNGGKRLVSILSAEAMFDPEAIEDTLKQAGGDVNMKGEASRNRAAASKVEEEQFVVFRLINEEFGVGIESVQEIVRVPEDVAKIPRTKDFIRGVMNLRGSVIPLIDQRARFGLPALEANDRQRIMVFRLGGVQTGFIVDSVSEVMRIRRDRIKPTPAMSEGQRKVIRRVANLPEAKRMILLLDADRMLDASEIEAVAAAAA
ncbi:chemotaxis protein CheW [Novosphingobium sp. FSY-8]|uniref:Chemotaxis protein CheW n=1 Tax=Novosphingobium ovatum TaxID=1908523 RepID=A0ABW9XFV1_9SPHN|nr:chemotaxis protein CheW [Novosphingobium ovatum]NBC37413.1 chemotaxis protein CheW [Novosphingobium ovatum]